jgi:hypothetical protein
LDFGHYRQGRGFAMPKARLSPTVQVLDFGLKSIFLVEIDAPRCELFWLQNSKSGMVEHLYPTLRTSRKIGYRTIKIVAWDVDELRVGAIHELPLPLIHHPIQHSQNLFSSCFLSDLGDVILDEEG